MTNQPDLPLVLHLRSDYESQPDHQAGHDLLVRDAGIRRRRVRNWREFSEALKEEIPALITIHYNELKNSHNQTPEKFINFVQGLVNYVGSNQSETEHNIPIAIGVAHDQGCTRNFVDQLKKIPAVVGIFLAVDGASSEGNRLRTQAHIEFLAGRTYWCHTVIDQLPVTKEKPVHIYFRETKDEGKTITQDLVDEYNQQLPVRVMMCTDWLEFDQLIAKTMPYQVVLHASHMSTQNATIPEMIEMIQTRLKLYNLHDVPIAMVVDRDTPLREVESWKQLGVFGIIPFIDDKSTHLESIKGVEALTNRIPYWPQHILDQLPAGRPLSIYFRGDWDEYKHTFDFEKFQKVTDLDLAYCSNWDQLDEALDCNPHQLIFHITELEKMDISISEIVTMLKTRLKLHGVDIPIGVGIMPYTTAAQIRELKRSGIHSSIPNAADWGIQETITAMHALRDRIPYWPRHIIDQLPGSNPRVHNKSSGTITLTVRQQEVMDLICRRGLSNKQIAKSLSLSESTVKIHVSAVMRAYGVRNRTQLALSASDNLKA